MKIHIPKVHTMHAGRILYVPIKDWRIFFLQVFTVLRVIPAYALNLHDARLRDQYEHNAKIYVSDARYGSVNRYEVHMQLPKLINYYIGKVRSVQFIPDAGLVSVYVGDDDDHGEYYVYFNDKCAVLSHLEYIHLLVTIRGYLVKENGKMSLGDPCSEKGIHPYKLFDECINKRIDEYIRIRGEVC